MLTISRRILLLIFTLVSSALAESGPAMPKTAEIDNNSPNPEQVMFPEEDHEEHYRNYVAGFAGYTSEERGEGGLTLGGEFSHRISKHIGVGLIAERIEGDVDAWVAAVGGGYRTERWKYYVGLGIEDAADKETEGLVRVGITHVIPWQKRTEWLLTGAVDFVDGEEVVVFGVALGYGF